MPKYKVSIESPKIYYYYITANNEYHAERIAFKRYEEGDDNMDDRFDADLVEEEEAQVIDICLYKGD